MMPVAVPEISVDLMSRGGLRAKVHCSVQGLRDMDAILGRDDRLVAKLADAATKLDAKFAAIIGTPVPAGDRNRLSCIKAYDREKGGSADHDCGYGWHGAV